MVGKAVARPKLFQELWESPASRLTAGLTPLTSCYCCCCACEPCHLACLPSSKNAKATILHKASGPLIMTSATRIGALRSEARGTGHNSTGFPGGPLQLMLSLFGMVGHGYGADNGYTVWAKVSNVRNSRPLGGTWWFFSATGDLPALQWSMAHKIGSTHRASWDNIRQPKHNWLR